MKYPLITALMVTTGRLNLIKESYKDFTKQTYPNKKLLIVTDCEEERHEALKLIAKEDTRIKIVYVKSPTAKSLGELRNIALDLGSNLSIQWDDDDRFSADRIMIQYNGLKKASAVLLADQFHYFMQANKVAWTEDQTGIQGTLLFDKKCGLKYPAEKLGEDTLLKNQLLEKDLINVVLSNGCYCRRYHGQNVWDLKHHLNRAKNFSKPVSTIDGKDLAKAAEVYNWTPGWKLLKS
jgi:glycosyltransferase involved in cell wall biosynthesis